MPHCKRSIWFSPYLHELDYARFMFWLALRLACSTWTNLTAEGGCKHSHKFQKMHLLITRQIVWSFVWGNLMIKHTLHGHVFTWWHRKAYLSIRGLRFTVSPAFVIFIPFVMLMPFFSMACTPVSNVWQPKPTPFSCLRARVVAQSWLVCWKIIRISLSVLSILFKIGRHLGVYKGSLISLNLLCFQSPLLVEVLKPLYHPFLLWLVSDIIVRWTPNCSFNV